ncbi:MAG: hypothetical protein GF331_24660 [Chitinivibrionales bacterium]|nr:hypothetical protein [Chitinivibrionales bacterium]
MRMTTLVSWLAAGALVASVHATGEGEPLTETACIERALRNDASVAVLRIGRAIDSLGLESAKAAWLPSVDIDASGTLTGDDAVGADVGLEVSQALPGGGTVNGSVSSSMAKAVGSSSPATTDHSYSVSLRQPLARDAWGYSAPAYSIRVQRLRERESYVRFIDELSFELTEVRKTYWRMLEKNRLLTIAEDALEHARRLLAVERARFEIGEAAAIDTLSASLEVLKAEQSLLASRNDKSRAQNELAEAIGLPPEEIILPDSISIDLRDPGSPEQLLARVRAFDPSLRKLAYTAERFQEQLRAEKRNLLPQVDLQATYYDPPPQSPMALMADNAVYSVVLSYTFPTKTKRIEVEQARLSAERNLAETQAYEQELTNNVTELVDAWHNDRRSLAIAELSHEVAQRYLEAAQRGYEVGTVDRIEYLQARDEAVAEAVRLVQKQVLLKQAEVVFDELTGETLTRFGVTVE